MCRPRDPVRRHHQRLAHLPESGRITASNPCSEYVHLDNSSCNLASINLLKFLRDDDTFAVERFRQITELIITAMDISICFADFPTEKITETTRAYRQLGIGYANLGALLMATGHAYDSDGGRAVAAAITSLMTGTAYRRSAELAAVVGPYDGYKRNAPRTSGSCASTPRPATRSGAGWDGRGDPRRRQQGLGQVRRAGEKNGYRNAQASLLAPTGCSPGTPWSPRTADWSGSQSWVMSTETAGRISTLWSPQMRGHGRQRSSS